ncbi:glycosyltransferase [Candidatus Pelagibacter sp.]|nr:glycosyltransferase [Candidatus Pelagibacter sp.]
MSLSRLTIIIPTFYPGRIIKKCLASLPSVSEIIIIDNGEDLELEKTIKLQKLKIKHFKVGDVGLSKSFNIALAKSKNENILITQPDVYFEKNSILNLIKAQKKYKKVGIISPLLFEKKKYSQYDYLDLSLSKSGNLQNKKKQKKINILPSGDICVEAVNATAMLIKKSIIKKINGWDENIYTYHEDIDLCLRLRKKKYSIMKVKNSIVHHIGFGSNKKKNKAKAEQSRNWHYCWSSLYFKDKYSPKINFISFYVKNLVKYFLKTILNFLLLRNKKFVLNLMRLRACLNYLFIKKASYRVKI